jgi:integron integrase
LRDALRARHYSPSTEQAYVSWVARFLAFHRRPAEELGASEVSAYLARLGDRGRATASTQGQALAALLFLYGDVLGRELGIASATRPRSSLRVPVVLSRAECATVIERMGSVEGLAVGLMYGSGLRIAECLRLRVKDIDFDRNEITVRNGKGAKDRVTVLPARLRDHLRAHLRQVRRQHEGDLAEGAGSVGLPGNLERTQPTAAWEWAWQWVFPSSRLHPHPGSARRQRLPMAASLVRSAFRQALRDAGIEKAASCHSLRHSFATHLVESGTDIRTVQQLMGHREVSTTLIYAHVLNQGMRHPSLGRPVQSPLDAPK